MADGRGIYPLRGVEHGAFSEKGHGQDFEGNTVRDRLLEYRNDTGRQAAHETGASGGGAGVSGKAVREAHARQPQEPEQARFQGV